MLKYSLILIIGICLISCNADAVFSDYKSLKNGWGKEEKVIFDFKAPDTINTYDLFINLRNDENFGFSNLFLIVDMDFPNGRTITDTLEYEMAKPNGEWLGTGFSDLKENKLWYKEGVVFPGGGDYKISIGHAMRKIGNVEGVTSLKGITDVGIALERKEE
ncbi:gliding motility lipoprotein GldH [Robertkochia solimangrovi]|uniref:gliding motility lipoprotein GldH n=1 Tax=Robertkochia solimangrovi TaxID=2213046 RepID=UPI00117EEBE9|nr:gliding motility lipoprotein GldH [Robertkochia solimangrovi]TRZ45982.1 gliding motility lipoprotein GldH [Robertkochia solimangrovi]